MTASALALVANARMYAVNHRVESLWRDLFEGIAVTSGVELLVVAHRAPLPLPDLWHRQDLGAAFMCGYPWIEWHEDASRPMPIAVPLRIDEDPSARSTYVTDIVVRSDSDARDIRDLRGRRLAYTTPESQSGYQAPRELLAENGAAAGTAWFSSTVGPLFTPRRVVDAVLAREADGGPLDDYWHALLRRHEPETAARLRVIATTPPAPMPFLVASSQVPDSIRDRIAHALVSASRVLALRGVLDALGLVGFAAVEPARYRQLSRMSRAADALGYVQLR